MKKKSHIFDKPANVKYTIIAFFSACILLLVLDFVLPKHDHAHFSFENKPAFFAIFGFVSCIILVVIAKYVLREMVKRKEGYYD